MKAFYLFSLLGLLVITGLAQNAATTETNQLNQQSTVTAKCAQFRTPVVPLPDAAQFKMPVTPLEANKTARGIVIDPCPPPAKAVKQTLPTPKPKLLLPGITNPMHPFAPKPQAPKTPGEIMRERSGPLFGKPR